MTAGESPPPVNRSSAFLIQARNCHSLTRRGRPATALLYQVVRRAIKQGRLDLLCPQIYYVFVAYAAGAQALVPQFAA